MDAEGALIQFNLLIKSEFPASTGWHISWILKAVTGEHSGDSMSIIYTKEVSRETLPFKENEGMWGEDELAPGNGKLEACPIGG
jgi:hypothetical protein